MATFLKTKISQATSPKTASRKTKPTEAEPVVVEVVEPEAETPQPRSPREEAIHAAFQRVADSVDQCAELMGAAAWKREFANIALGLIGYGTALYVGLKLLDMLLLALVMYTGPGFVAFMVAFLGLIAMFMAAYAVGVGVYRLAASFDATKFQARIAGVLRRRAAEPMEARHA